MKLVEILAREMSNWPDDGTDVVGQAADGVLHLNASFSPNRGFTDKSYTMADDWKSADVTRADWEAERARIKGEKAMPKANKDGWIRHRGGNPPVGDDVRVEYRMRNGYVACDDAGWLDWSHKDDEQDIMAWRPHKAEQVTSEQSSGVEMPAAKYFDGPLQWRDRIFELDAEQSQADEAHKAATEARNTERAELVAKLKAEGLALVQAEEDMSDWRNWRKGDVLEIIDTEFDTHGFKIGSMVSMIRHDDNRRKPAPYCKDEKGNKAWVQATNLKWHSRPSN